MTGIPKIPPASDSSVLFNKSAQLQTEDIEIEMPTMPPSKCYVALRYKNDKLISIDARHKQREPKSRSHITVETFYKYTSDKKLLTFTEREFINSAKISSPKKEAAPEDVKYFTDNILKPAAQKTDSNMLRKILARTIHDLKQSY